tara:strand:+ start:789 stop:1070 length:282 start_codon:yes stop_codon:yes gene_type:complete
MIWKHSGVTYDIQLSKRKGKKLQATYLNKETGRKNTIHFGEAGYQHFYDKSELLPKSLNHNDLVRRQRYIDRHKSREDWSIPSAGMLSKNILW